MSDLDRFVTAQDGAYRWALDEVRSGRKIGHWMWFVFPQLAGLGRSERARFYGLAGLDEARAYLAHPALGPRLIEISTAMLAHSGQRPESILGGIDARKLRSCATLFEAAGGGPIFTAILEDFYGGERCPLTLTLLQ